MTYADMWTLCFCAYDTCQSIEKGGLPAPGRTHDGQELAGSGIARQPFKYRFSPIPSIRYRHPEILPSYIHPTPGILIFTVHWTFSAFRFSKALNLRGISRPVTLWAEPRRDSIHWSEQGVHFDRWCTQRERERLEVCVTYERSLLILMLQTMCSVYRKLYIILHG